MRMHAGLATPLQNIAVVGPLVDTWTDPCPCLLTPKYTCVDSMPCTRAKMDALCVCSHWHILEHTDEFYEDLAASEHIHRQTWRYSINGCMCINTPDMESEEDSNRRSNSCRQRHSNTTTPSARMTLPEMTT